MDIPIYPFKGPITEYRYQFTSSSIDKNVAKVVRFSELSDDMYNLALFDQQPDGSESSDMTETKNKDMNIVLATVMKIVVDFLHQKPTYFVFIQGSDSKRKRLYQILMNKEHQNLKGSYLIWGGNDTQTELFEKGKTYTFFVITKR